MFKNKKNLAIISIVDSILFFGVNLSISKFVGNKNGYNWAFFISLMLSFAGIVFAIYALVKVDKYWKILPLLGLIANIGIFLNALLVYSFSYWQF